MHRSLVWGLLALGVLSCLKKEEQPVKFDVSAKVAVAQETQTVTLHVEGMT